MERTVAVSSGGKTHRPDPLYPVTDTIKALAVGCVVQQKNALQDTDDDEYKQQTTQSGCGCFPTHMSTSKVRFRDGTKPFLPSSVPNLHQMDESLPARALRFFTDYHMRSHLQFDINPTNRCVLDLEVDADGGNELAVQRPGPAVRLDQLSFSYICRLSVNCGRNHRANATAWRNRVSTTPRSPMARLRTCIPYKEQFHNWRSVLLFLPRLCHRELVGQSHRLAAPFAKLTDFRVT